MTEPNHRAGDRVTVRRDHPDARLTVAGVCEGHEPGDHHVRIDGRDTAATFPDDSFIVKPD
ncbi:MAG TPA: hypothetical protein VLI05_00165 [Candidatus Saccharimonadia bacterium]|nr:hypothetical protein [Candidatus Saccharimonadia bacterium]